MHSKQKFQLRSHARSRRLIVAFSPCTTVSYEVLTRWISQVGVLEATGSMPGFVNTHVWSTCHHFVKARADVFFVALRLAFFSYPLGNQFHEQSATKILPDNRGQAPWGGATRGRYTRPSPSRPGLRSLVFASIGIDRLGAMTSSVC